MQESTARELIDAIESLTVAVSDLGHYFTSNGVSLDELKTEVRGLGGEMGRLGSDLSSLGRSVDSNTSAVEGLASDVRNSSSRY